MKFTLVRVVSSRLLLALCPTHAHTHTYGTHTHAITAENTRWNRRDTHTIAENTTYNNTHTVRDAGRLTQIAGMCSGMLKNYRAYYAAFGAAEERKRAGLQAAGVPAVRPLQLAVAPRHAARCLWVRLLRSSLRVPGPHLCP